jgi:uncharacterized membrane protein YadS
MATNVSAIPEERPSEWSLMLRGEDWWSVWLGMLLLAIGMLIFLPRPPADLDAKIEKLSATMKSEEARAPFRTIAYWETEGALNRMRARDAEPGKTIGTYLATTARWKDSPLEAFYLSEADAAKRAEAAKPRREAALAKQKTAKEKAKASEDAAAAAGFKDAALNDAARTAIADWRAVKIPSAPKAHNYLPGYLVVGIGLMLFWALGNKVMGRGIGQFMLAFPAVFLLTILAFAIGNQVDIRAMGFSSVLWSIFLGMLIANTVGTPKWIMPAVQTEFYIKTGLVLLGASILFGKIVLIGIPGVFVAWVVTPIVLVLTYWFGQKIVKLPSKELNMTVSADMSVSGVSAAIATAAACRAKKEELTLAIGLSMVFTAVMIFAMPALINGIGMPKWFDGAGEVLAGAWMGGTIDNTGSVVAAGELVGRTAMYTAATIKMIQNIMIGVVAFGVAAYWALKVERERSGTAGRVDLTFGAAAGEIWRRFPRFILGFVAASIVFSILYDAKGAEWGKVMLEQGVLGGWADPLRDWFFGMAFVSIGLATNFRELAVHFKGGKPVILYVCGQTLNIVLTLAMAYLMFFVVFFPLTQRIMAM